VKSRHCTYFAVQQPGRLVVDLLTLFFPLLFSFRWRLCLL